MPDHWSVESVDSRAQTPRLRTPSPTARECGDEGSPAPGAGPSMFPASAYGWLSRHPARVLWGLIAFRSVQALVISTSFAPDEFWQGPEVAHRLVTSERAALRPVAPARTHHTSPRPRAGLWVRTFHVGMDRATQVRVSPTSNRTRTAASPCATRTVRMPPHPASRPARRSYWHPLFLAAPLEVVKFLGLDTPAVVRVTPRLMHGTVAALVDFCILHLTQVMTRDGREYIYHCSHLFSRHTCVMCRSGLRPCRCLCHFRFAVCATCATPTTCATLRHPCATPNACANPCSTPHTPPPQHWMGKEYVPWAALAQLSYWFNGFCLVRSYSNCLESLLLMASLCLWDFPLACLFSLVAPPALPRRPNARPTTTSRRRGCSW